MKTIKTIKDLKLKDGTMIPKGSTLEFVRTSETSPDRGFFMHNGVQRCLRFRAVVKNPSMRSLEKWANDSVCKSVFGAQVEPDGFGSDGEPSWLLAMGLI